VTARQFVYGHLGTADAKLKAASVFSGAGLSDIGYARAGFRLHTQAEIDPHRSALGKANFPAAEWIAGDVTRHVDDFVASVGEERLDLLSLTPPCQGLSSSNPTRGRRRTPDAERNHERNMLLLDAMPLVERLQPRVFVCENVRQVLTLPANDSGDRMVDVLSERLSNYRVYSTVVNVADYGIPQARLRAVIVGIHNTEKWLPGIIAVSAAPWPRRSHSSTGDDGSPWISVGEWLTSMRYKWLDAAEEGTAIGSHRLHRVPIYDHDRYLQVASIPANSGRSAYENDSCPSCGVASVPVGRAYCPSCRRAMRNRPYVARRGGFRLIRGFHSSYRRMRPDQPAPPVMTSSGRVGSDYKIHPWEHRVMSILECADLQSVPRSYDWSFALDSKRFGLIREVIGEALPPYFTFLHGSLLSRLIRGDESAIADCAPASSVMARIVKRSTVSRRDALTGRAPERVKGSRALPTCEAPYL
jgi:DNA (cytosine-5)-methyltransferase 1